jgi:tripartite-type tricarboxylate transporter receptor subunit TctC
MTSARSFPSRPVEIYVSAQKGGPSDGIARIIAAKLSQKWSQPVTVEHKAPMNACFDHVARAPADGHTLLMGGGGFFINGTLYRNLPFDPATDFDPVILVASIANVLVIHPSIPARTLQEFIAYAKANPGKLTYGSSGFGGPPHLAGELFQQMTGTRLNHAAYKGHVAAGHALVEGKDVQLMFDAVLTGKEHIDKGETVALAVTTLKRVAILPDVPTMTESGLPGYEINPDMGVLVPDGTPKEVVAALNAGIKEVMLSPEVQQTMETSGMIARGSTPEEFGEYAKGAFGKWQRVLRNAGIESRDAPLS